MKIVLDVFGGDFSPQAQILGAKEALQSDSTLSLVLVGREEIIKELLAENKVSTDRIEVVNAESVVTFDDPFTAAIKEKKDSSLAIAIDITNQRDDICGMVTCSNTGAALTGATLKIGRIDKVKRAALSAVLPTLLGGRVCLMDAGANVEVSPEVLVQFAVMGSEYMRACYKIESPRVALVSNGTEESKGNALTKAAYPLLEKAPINFVGNMEARDALSGDYDVLVCDGFTGNVLLKSIEGTFAGVVSIVKKALKRNCITKFGSLFIRKSLRKELGALKSDELGAAAFLGCKKLVAKAHGNSKEKEIKAALLQVKKMAEGKLVEKIENYFKENEV